MHRKIVEFRLTPGDISALRFGISPGMELAGAVRTLLDPGQHPLHWGWVRATRDEVPPSALTLLGALIGSDGYLPDFITSEPAWDLTPELELSRLRQADPYGVRRDLAKVTARATGRRRTLVEQLGADPEHTRGLVADAWEQVWEAAVGPRWPTLERMLNADIATRVRRVGHRGLAAMVDTLHERVSWQGSAVHVTMRGHSEVVDCTGTGLTLVPSVFLRTCAAVTELPSPPLLFYPAHGVSETWARRGDDDALVALLSEGRARVLLALHEPLSTTETARASGLAVSTTSHHLTVLRGAALVDSRRAGRTVMHARTHLGDALVSSAR